MKKILLVLLLLIPLLVLGQGKKEKLKGTKIVELKTQVVEEFTAIEVGGIFEVELVLKPSPTISIDADSNFHEFINVNVIDGKLSISASKQFTRYKKLLIEIGVTSKLTNIFVKDKAKLLCKNNLLSENINVETYGDSKVTLGFKSKNASFVATDKSEIEAEGESETVSLNVTEASDVNINVEAINLAVVQNTKSKLVLNGKSQNSVFQITGDSFLDSSGFVSRVLVFSATENADSYINVADKLTLDISGKTNTYVLGNPLLNIQSFKENASLHKTNKAPSTLKSFLK